MASEGERFDRDFLAGGRPPRKIRTRHERRMERSGGPSPGVAFAHVPLLAEVAIEVDLYPTEDPDRVRGGLSGIFPDVVWEQVEPGGRLRGAARDLTRLAEILRANRIRDAARPVLMEEAVRGGPLRFRLNKQAAVAGRVNFVQGPLVLGAALVEARAPDPVALAEELTWIEGESDDRLFGKGTRARLRGETRRR